MSSRGSCGKDYAAKRRRELQRDINCGATSGWATEEEIAARRADMDRSVCEEVRGMPSRPQEAPGPKNPTFMGPINARHAFSHNVQGEIPPSTTKNPLIPDVLVVTFVKRRTFPSWID